MDEKKKELEINLIKTGGIFILVGLAVSFGALDTTQAGLILVVCGASYYFWKYPVIKKT